MTARERVLRAITFAGPDRAPLRHNVTGAAVIKHGERLLDILAQYPDDYGTVTTFPTFMERRRERRGRVETDEQTTDAWGCVWRHRQDGLFGMCIGRPLEDWAALDAYDPPPLPPCTPELVEERRRLFAEKKQKWYVSGGGCMIWERMQLLRGDANLMMDLVDRRPEVERLADMLFDWARRLFEPSLLAGCDGVEVGDDWGNQSRLRIRPEVWRCVFKPRYQDLFRFVHNHDALVRFHSCGHVLEILPDLVEIGVDVLNIQSSCMPLPELARLTRGKLCLEVDIDRQYEMPYGTPADVRRRAEACFEALWRPEGGFVWLTEIGPDVPLENVAAYYEACRELG